MPTVQRRPQGTDVRESVPNNFHYSHFESNNNGALGGGGSGDGRTAVGAGSSVIDKTRLYESNGPPRSTGPRIRDGRGMDPRTSRVGAGSASRRIQGSGRRTRPPNRRPRSGRRAAALTVLFSGLLCVFLAFTFILPMFFTFPEGRGILQSPGAQEHPSGREQPSRVRGGKSKLSVGDSTSKRGIFVAISLNCVGPIGCSHESVANEDRVLVEKLWNLLRLLAVEEGERRFFVSVLDGRSYIEFSSLPTEVASFAPDMARLRCKFDQVVRRVTKDDPDTALRNEVLDQNVGHRSHNILLDPMYQIMEDHPFDDVIFIHNSDFMPDKVRTLAVARKHGNAMVACGIDRPELTEEEVNDRKRNGSFTNRDLHGKKFAEAGWLVNDHVVPYPVGACWSSVVAVGADTFQELGIRFRTAFSFECDSSDRELISRDLWAAGHARILFVPVKLSEGNLDNVWIANSYVFPETAPEQMECCGARNLDGFIDWRSCFMQDHWVSLYQKLHRFPRVMEGDKLGKPEVVIDDGLILSQAHSIDDVYHMVRVKYKCFDEALLGKIPNRVMQIGKSKILTDMNFRAAHACMSWLIQNPCALYRFIDDAAIDHLLETSADHRFVMAYRSLSNGGERADLFRYYTLYHEGGIYADTDTHSVKPLEEWIHPNDEFVVGLEASFISKQKSLEWVYARQRSASLHTWATSRNNPVLKKILDTVLFNIENPNKVYKEVRARENGAPSHLETILKTGPGPFSDCVLAEGSGVRALSLTALSGAHDQGDKFYNLMTPESYGDGEVFVQHFNFGAWLKPHPFVVRNGNIDWLRNHEDLMAGEWITNGNYDMTKGAKNITCVEGYRPPHFVLSDDDLMFLWLSNDGIVQVRTGLGPRDPESRLVMELPPPPKEEISGGKLALRLDSTGRLSISIYMKGTYLPKTVKLLSHPKEFSKIPGEHFMVLLPNSHLCVYKR